MNANETTEKRDEKKKQKIYFLLVGIDTRWTLQRTFA